MIHRILWLIAPLLLITMVLNPAGRSHDALAASSTFGVSSTGLKYPMPSVYFTHCASYTWLQGANYRTGCGGPTSPQQQLSQDLTFIQSQHLGSFLRVWISLDQLFGCWSATTGFCGYDATSLANLDDALHQFASHGIKIELGMLVWEVTCDPSLTTSPFQHCFHPEALDGNHASMRANYLAAVQQFAAHLATDPGDLAAIAAIDTQSEAYYQDETYLASPAHLGQWAYAMPSWPTGTQCYTLGNTVCTGGSAGHGCLSGSNVDTACIDVNIIEPWLRDLYLAVKQGGPILTVTVGDTGRLLTTDTGTYTGQQHWISLYSPVADVYDIHLYDDQPWNYTARWATWVNLDKPYFVGEAGCATGNKSCTYNTGAVSAPLQYWMTHMTQDYGAQAVLVEDMTTVWIYHYVNGTGAVPALTPSGQFLQQMTAASPLPPPATAPPTRTPITLPTPPGAYHPVNPFRVLDTRKSHQTLYSGWTLSFAATGQGGVPSTGVSAVVLNVTATNTSANGWMAVFPAGLGVPNASNLNWNAGQTVANVVEVAVDSSGMVSLYSPLGQVDAVVDVEGYVTAPSGTTGLYNPLLPARLLDTRPGHQTLGPNGSITFAVTGQGGVPSSGVSAVVLNITATDTTTSGWLTVYPAGQGTPNASNLNWSPGETRPNRVIVPVGAGGQVTIFSPLGSVDVVVDVGGYFTDGSTPSATGSLFSGTSPSRILDTRSMGGPVGPGGSVHLQVAGNGGVPSMNSATPPRAVVLNVTATSPTTSGWLVAYPSSSGIPGSSDLNYGPGETIPNLVVVKLGPDGAINLYNCCGQVQVIVDVTGWYS